ncbi:MAG: hypothetical protein GYA61_01160 [Spirochaetales bacterium]|jgi:phosphoesterase RecJ-like protein|nr:DHH family phosphoesterase [Exilispira sp.]NMC66811.1 hypothetical protein [Spirochaetales bacterium]
MVPNMSRELFNYTRHLQNNEREVFFNFFKNKKNIAIISHKDPDGDAIASLASIYFFCEIYNISSDIFLFNMPPFYDYNKWNLSLNFLSNFNQENYDGIVFVDTPSLQRSGLKNDFSLKKPSLCIDHHIDNQFFCNSNIVAPYFCSTTEIIYEVLKSPNFFSFLSSTVQNNKKENLINNLYESLLMGILFDTYYFNTENVDSLLLKRCSELDEKTGSLHKLKNNLFKNQNPSIYKFWGAILSNISLYFENKLVIAKANRNLFIKFEKEYKDFSDVVATEGFINHLMSLRNVNIAIFIRELENEIKVSIRSNIKVASNLANIFGGGGHANAAAFTLERNKNLDIDNLEIEIIKVIEKEGYFEQNK